MINVLIGIWNCQAYEPTLAADSGRDWNTTPIRDMLFGFLDVDNSL